MKKVAAAICLLAVLIVLPVSRFVHQPSAVVADGSPSPAPHPHS
jgi:hypothetical protein